MAKWLVKQEPSSYSFSDLEREGRTRWDGVHNALALRHLKAMRPGDEAIFYHSGEERAGVGTLRVVGTPRADERDERGSWYVEVAAGTRWTRPVPLAEIRADPAFAGFILLRMSRLSVMPVPEPLWKRLAALSSRGAAAPATAAPKGRGRAAARRPKPPSAPRRR